MTTLPLDDYLLLQRQRGPRITSIEHGSAIRGMTISRMRRDRGAYRAFQDRFDTLCRRTFQHPPPVEVAQLKTSPYHRVQPALRRRCNIWRRYSGQPVVRWWQRSCMGVLQHQVEKGLKQVLFASSSSCLGWFRPEISRRRMRQRQAYIPGTAGGESNIVRREAARSIQMR